MAKSPFSCSTTPDWEGLVSCIRREGTPDTAYNIELFLDVEVQEAICERYDLLDSLDRGDPSFILRRSMAAQRFLGYDYVRCGVDGLQISFNSLTTEDTAEYCRQSGRNYLDEHTGPISNWEDFEKFRWPDPDKFSTESLEWYSKNLPDDMCIIGSGGFAHFYEWLSFLVGYERLCYALFEQRDLLAAMVERIREINVAMVELLLQFDRVKMLWGGDDLGYRSGTLISPDDLREFVLPGHKLMAKMSHDAGRPYLLHSCGKLSEIMDDLIEDVGIDAKHSFEDTIEDVTDAKIHYGDKIALLGGIDVDFLCRATKEQVRGRVRRTLEKCQPGGGYCLGTGNSVANYIPLDNYLTMLDEGRRFVR